MPLVYYCLMCGQNVSPNFISKEMTHQRAGRACGPIDVWEQDRIEDFNDVDESEESV